MWSVPAMALIQVKHATPLELVTAVPVVPVLGPDVTVKVTVAPGIGAPALFLAVAQTVCGVPTLLVAMAGSNRRPPPTMALTHLRKNPAKKMLSSVEGFCVKTVTSVVPL